MSCGNCDVDVEVEVKKEKSVAFKFFQNFITTLIFVSSLSLFVWGAIFLGKFLVATIGLFSVVILILVLLSLVVAALGTE